MNREAMENLLESTATDLVKAQIHLQRFEAAKRDEEVGAALKNIEHGLSVLENSVELLEMPEVLPAAQKAALGELENK